MATTARGRLRLLLMPSLAMAIMVMDTAMVTVMDMAMEATAMDITATMARGRLRLLLLLSPAMDTTVMDMDMATVMDMAMVAMDITMARDLLRLSPDMDTTAMDMDMDMATVTDTDTAMDIMATTARGLLMLSPDMATTAMDMDMDMDMATTVTDMAMATMDKSFCYCLVQSRVQYKQRIWTIWY